MGGRSKVAIINLIYYAFVIYRNSIECSQASSRERFFLIDPGEEGEHKPAQGSKVPSPCVLLLKKTHIHIYTTPVQSTGTAGHFKK